MQRRVVGLKKRFEELRSELDVANAELEDAKCAKETDEQEFKGYEVELAMNEGMAFGPLSFPHKPSSQQKRRKIKNKKERKKN